jgi:hypothetical protein
MQWYHDIASALQRAWGDGWQLLLVSDGEQSQLQPLLEEFPCVITADLADGDCSDALALAGSDLLVCSASSYSVMAAFLSDAPYLWFAPNLQLHPEGYYSAGGGASESDTLGSARHASAYFLAESAQQPSQIGRGTALDVGGAVPAAVLAAAEHRHRWRRWELDLVRGGVAPVA